MSLFFFDKFRQSPKFHRENFSGGTSHEHLGRKIELELASLLYARMQKTQQKSARSLVIQSPTKSNQRKAQNLRLEPTYRRDAHRREAHIKYETRARRKLPPMFSERENQTEQRWNTVK